MERRPEEESADSPGNQLSVADAVRIIAAHNARHPTESEELLLLTMQSWWSKTYNRPLKDPMLLSYTLEELLYEYYDRIERELAQKERLELENDKIEDDKLQADLDWAEKEELKEMQKDLATSKQDPTKDPDNVRWMEEQLKAAKAQFGESFGEDVDDNFEG